MPATCRADVEALLRARKLDRTLVPVTATSGSVVVADTVSTGLPVLDQQLGGGIPQGHFSEIVGARSTGRTSLTMSLLAAATGRGDLVALIDTFDAFDAASAAAAGVRLDHLLWVRGECCTPAFPLLAARQTGAERALERAVKAMNLVLQAGGFALVVLDLADAPTLALRRVPMTTWMRLQRVLEGQSTAGLVLAPTSVARSSGGVTLALKHGALNAMSHVMDSRTPSPEPRVPSPESRVSGCVGLWATAPGPLGMFEGLTSHVHIQRARLVPGREGPVSLRASAQVA